MPIYDNCFHITVTGLTAGTHTAYSIFRSLNYEYEDSTSKEYYFKVNKIPLTLKFNGLTQYNNYDIRETSNIELEIEFNIVGVNIWGNEVQAYNFPYKVYCNDVLLTGDDHVFTYTFEKAGTYTFKVVSEENEKYLASEYSETIVITDSGATETNITIDFTTDSQSSIIYPYDTIHITANITPSDLSDKVILKIYRNNNLIDTITGNTFTNSDKIKAGDYKVVAEYDGDKFYLPCSAEYTFTVTAEPTDFTDLKFTTTGNIDNIYVNGIYYGRLTDNQGMAELTINLNPANYNMVIGFNDETMINNCNNQNKTNILVNNNYGSTVKEFTMTVQPPVKVTKHATTIGNISFLGESRAWSSIDPSLISTDTYSEYMSCLNINNRYSKIKRPNSLHFKGFNFNIPSNATIHSVEARFKTTFWGHNSKSASFDSAWCGFPALSNQGYEQGVKPNENSWTESRCTFICYGANKKYTITPSFLNSDFVFALDFGQNTSSNSADFGLVYFELSVYYIMPDE